MSLLCFDISSGGISAALLNTRLDPIRSLEARWTPSATLRLEDVAKQFKKLTRELTLASASDPIAAVSIGSFLHNFVLLDSAVQPLTPVFTWLDSRGEEGVQLIRSHAGDTFHERTGCRYHPMYPVFKLASLAVSDSALLSKADRVVSVKSFFVHALTDSWSEDHGMASASGLFNVRNGGWDEDLMNLAGLNGAQLPAIQSRSAVVGRITPRAADEFGLPADAVVVNGSGDGFLANIGSGCETPEKISVTLGTSAAARQTMSRAVLDLSSGTFCYQADDAVYLLGCAGSNGGNVLDWGRSIFGTLKDASDAGDVPIFIPLLHGERSPDWNPRLTASWYELTARHTAADLSRSILEGVIFNLAHFVEILKDTSGTNPADVVLSGNGFLEPIAAPILATVVDAAVWMPAHPGLASLRGSGICALRVLGLTIPSLEVKAVSPLADMKIGDRYRRYRSLRRLKDN